MTLVFHEIETHKVEAVLRSGLICTSGGDKRDAAITKTEEFLNRHRPPQLAKAGVDRLTNIYCYLADGDTIVDITSGEKKTPAEIITAAGQSLLRVEVDPRNCYVSNLDTYDHIKALLERDDKATASQVAATYWQQLEPLAQYRGTMQRPEVLVTYDVPPDGLTKVV